MNRLQHETSPYLLQHAHNPVDWYAWKPEAFERARKEDKPILVSIGYSTCHWCHVMERESFEDEQIAAYMNEHYINIKVDREERPDVDQIYMDACQALTGSGGWPLNCFLLPDGRPFYAGTYYPPLPRYNRPSWQQVLEQMNHHYQHDREKVEEQADRLTESIRRTDTMFIKDELIENSAGEPLFQRSDLTAIYQQLEQRFDREHGGFGGAPKFPGTMNLEFLLRYYHHFDQPEALQHVQFSLTRMIRGGIYDQLGGGFARYATDEAWLVPHFEKMLYDNALLVSLLADVYQVTGEQLYRDTIEDTLGFIEREMTSSEGGFYSALDADSEGEEGKFYVWDKKQIEATLGDDAPLVLDYYGVSEGGNWEGKNILWRPSDEKAFSEKWSISLDELRQRLASAKVRLFTVRALRYRPGLDDKILLDWNSLQVKAYARAAQALENRDYQRKAVDHLEFLLEHLAQEEGPGFYHVYKDGQRQYDAFLNDYAYLIDALIAVYELTLETRYLDRAHTLTEYVIDNFLDRSSNLFYFTSRKQQDILMQRKDLYDSTMPSGNSAMVDNLIRMAIFFERAAYQQLAEQMLARMGDSISKYPASFPNWAMQIFKQVFPVFEIAVVGSNAQTVVHKVHRHYLPNKVIMGSEEPRADFPLLRDKSVLPDTKIYVCQNYSCQLPVSSIQEMLEQLGAHT